MTPPSLSLLGLVVGAEEACRRNDLAQLSSLVRSLVPRLPRALQFDAVAVAELAALDVPLACERWAVLAAALGVSHGTLGDVAA